MMADGEGRSVSWLVSQVSIEPGVLYVVATPLGNLDDISRRALAVLEGVELIAAEDTRHTRGLLAHFGIATALSSLHEHNEAARVPGLIARLHRGDAIALVSDAGTPLISDPGFRLVRTAREQGVRVSPVPGPSAVVAALSAAGLATDRFIFEGFLPAKAGARDERLRALADDTRTLVFFESSHRIVRSLGAMAEAFGASRRGVIARELTKLHEEIRGDELGALATWLEAHPGHQRGEFVVVVEGGEAAGGSPEGADLRRILEPLLGELPLSQAVRLASRISAQPRNKVYAMALELGGGSR